VRAEVTGCRAGQTEYPAVDADIATRGDHGPTPGVGPGIDGVRVTVRSTGQLPAGLVNIGPSRDEHARRTAYS